MTYAGESYLDYPALERACRELEARAPELVRVHLVGTSRHGRPLVLLTLGDRRAGDPDSRPGFWLDGGTHASEWTGVMAALYTACRWVDGWLAGDAELVDWFSRHTAYVLPCLSPDGFQALHDGAPFLRSTLRPPRDGRPRVGLDPCDVDGDGEILWMRFRHPAGPWVFDSENPARFRHRALDDHPADAFFVCSEGRLLGWDGVRWREAAREHGLDLNRNFPASWAPFSMFGMDGGDYPLSEPEARAAVEAFRARPRIGAALTNHTYTGCLLTQPYRDPSPLSREDIELMARLAHQSVVGTGYRVLRVVPQFTYDKAKAIVGVWADTLSTTFGVPGYTLELWDPYGHAGVPIDDPAEQFRTPDIATVNALVDAFWAEDPDCVVPWRPFDHPELGPVEIGGLRYMRTVRNPPTHLLPAECGRGFTVADRLRRSLPRVEVAVSVQAHGDARVVEVVVDNLGYLGTSALSRGEEIGVAPPIRVDLRLEGGAELVEGHATRDLGWLDGWGVLHGESARHPVYPDLPGERGTRTVARWTVRGGGRAVVTWDAGRAGKGEAWALLD